MISIYDLKIYAKKHPDCWFGVNDNDEFYNKSTNEIYDSGAFLKTWRHIFHCDFESIYYCPASLLHIVRCRECGTVIFSSEDEYYDDELSCPTCSDYKTSFKFWTDDEIKSDKDKSETIKFYEDLTSRQEEAEERYRKRGNLYDWQRFKKKLCFNCFKNNVFIEEPFVEEAYKSAIDWAYNTIEQIMDTNEFLPKVDYFKCNYLCGVSRLF